MVKQRFNLYDLTFADLENHLSAAGESSFRAKQIFEWLYKKDVSDARKMTNLPASLREKLANEWSTELPCAQEVSTGSDGTEKWLFDLASRSAKSAKTPRIESVLMPSDDRFTLCVSSQAGCALDCRFCATATMGFIRNLEPAEIIGQVIHARRRLAEKFPAPTNQKPVDDRAPVRPGNIVFMGMGEPLLNFDNLCVALENLTSEKAMGMSPSRITVSTAGVAPKLVELSEKYAVNIAISLNAPDAELRERIMPRVAGKYDLPSLLAAARAIGKSRRKPVTFEYVLLSGVTDGVDDAKELVKLLQGIRCKINLIPFNPFQGAKYQRPDPRNVIKFQKILWDADIPAYIRWSQGLDVNAACGQLAGRRS